MTFISILCALFMEQLKPLRANNFLYAWINKLALRMEAWFNFSQVAYGKLAWFAMVLLLAIPTGLVYFLLMRVNVFLALIWNIVIVYLTLGFRHYSHFFTSIQLALHAGDVATARRMLSQWIDQDTETMEVNEIARVASLQAIVYSHRNVFGVFFWFLLPLGPAGAVIYRVAEHLASAWNRPSALGNTPFGEFATRVFRWMDYIPVRLTAIAFAVVGNFEDAIYAWRNFASHWKDEAVGILLSSGGGAMGYRLNEPYLQTEGENMLDISTVDSTMLDAEVLPGVEPSVRILQSTVGLVWRALLLWMLMLLMLSIAVWVG